MAELQLGQKVSVNLVGLHVAEVEFGGSTIANGVAERDNRSVKHFIQRAAVLDRFTRPCERRLVSHSTHANRALRVHP